VANAFLEAMKVRQPVSIFYLGGSTPGILRRFKPNALYRLTPGGPIFATGICELRHGTRTLRLDRVRLA
jgi:predicted DNA-binding transcriptional regulator YafY